MKKQTQWTFIQTRFSFIQEFLDVKNIVSNILKLLNNIRLQKRYAYGTGKYDSYVF